MDKKEYIIRQLGRTKNKKYEMYVVCRIIHKLDDFDLKFVTQQYVARPDGGRALTDLYFPQLGVHVEVDEPFHLSQEEADKRREQDIVNATDHTVERIKISGLSLDEINQQIADLIERIEAKRKALKTFTPWDYEKEFCSETYVKKGHIDIADNVAFRTIKDVCNCFGHNYKGWQKGGASHPEDDTILWFPKLYKNGEWNNCISDDEETIKEENEDKTKALEHVRDHLALGGANRRVVFARVKSNLGDVMYRFRGLYVLDIPASRKSGTQLIWRREAKCVKTYAA